ncbi:MAG: DegT/DnrJ/EryC1/StrS family aminotransferase [Candidatus Nitrosopumilus sp. bin_6a]
MKTIKLFDPFITKEEEKTVLRVLKSHFWASGAGIENVKKFEDSFKKYINCDQCIAVNSGTAALHLALSLFDLKGKEVILPSMTFVSTAHAVIMNGGKPIFTEIDDETLCLDSQKIEEGINKKTQVVLPVHFGGMPCDLKSIQKICKKNNLELVEDAAHAAGSEFNKEKIGKHGKAVCFSFHPVKNLAMPTGGLIAINSNKSNSILEDLKSKRWCGIKNRKKMEYDVSEIGWNYYMNEFSAAIGLTQLKRLDKMNSIRKKIAKRYSEEIKLERKMPYDKNCSYHLYWIRIKNREKFVKKMEVEKIEVGIHYKPIHKMTYYKNKIKLPITEKIGNEVISIPIHQNLKDDEIEKIIKTVNKFS